MLQQLGRALWTLKGLYDQHRVNKKEIESLQELMDEYQKLVEVFKDRGADDSRFSKLERVIIEATSELEKWATDQSFFRLFSANERMKRLDRLQKKVDREVQQVALANNISIWLILKGKDQRAASPQLKADQVRSFLVPLY